MAEAIAFVAEQAAEFVFNVVLSSIPAGVADGTALAIAEVAANVAYVIVEVGAYAGLSAALAPKLPHQDMARATLRTTYGSRRSGYGRARFGGAATMLWEAKENAYDVHAYLQGPIDGIETVYFHDDMVSVDPATHRVRDTYSDHRYIKSGHGPWVFWNLGAAAETSFASLGLTFGGETYAALGTDVWTVDHRGDGVVSGGLVCLPVEQADLSRTYPNGPPVLTFAGRLLPCYDWRDGSQDLADPTTWKWTTNPYVCLAHYECFHEHGPLHDFAMRIAPSLAFWTAAADVCDEMVDQANVFVSLTAEAIKGATTIHVPDTAGITNGDTIWMGDPGQPVVVSGHTGTTITFAPGLEDVHIIGSPVHWAVTSGVVQAKRYELGGVFEYANTPADVRKQILDCCDGWMTEAGDGSLFVLAGKYYAPTVTIDADLDHVLAYTWKQFSADQEAVNQLDVTYTLPAAGFAEADAGSWFDNVDLAARGKSAPTPFKVPWAQNLSQVRRLAKRKMLSRYAPTLTGTVTVNLFGLQCLRERYLGLNIPEIGVLTAINIEVSDKVDMDLANMSFTFPWIATPGAVIDDWDPATEEGGASLLRSSSPVLAPGSIGLGGVANSISLAGSAYAIYRSDNAVLV